MVTLRCTRKLLTKLPPSQGVSLSDTPSTTALVASSPVLGDWYLTYLTCRPKHLLLAVSEHSRLAVLFPSAPVATFVPRLVQALREVLQECGISDGAIDSELEKMTSYQLAPTQSRSHLGTMNEYVKTLDYSQDESETGSPLELSLFLNRQIWRPLEYRTPEEVTRHLLEGNA